MLIFDFVDVVVLIFNVFSEVRVYLRRGFWDFRILGLWDVSSPWRPAVAWVGMGDWDCAGTATSATSPVGVVYSNI